MSRVRAAPARCSSSRAPTVAATGGSCPTRPAGGRRAEGIHDGQQIRVRGEGHAGFRSTDRGHAFVVVRVRPDPRFVRDGDDLHTALRLTMTEAALGTTATVTSLSGEVDAGRPAPGRSRARYASSAARGCRRCEARDEARCSCVSTSPCPTALDEEQRALVEQLDEKLDDEAYRPRDEDERLLQPSEERAPLSGLLRVAFVVPSGRGRDRARMARRACTRRLRGRVDGGCDRARGVRRGRRRCGRRRRLPAGDRRAGTRRMGGPLEGVPPARRRRRALDRPAVDRSARGREPRSSSTRAARSARAGTRRRGPASSCCRGSIAAASSTPAAARVSWRSPPCGSASRRSWPSISTRSPSRWRPRPRA